MTKHDSKDEDILAGAPEGATHVEIFTQIKQFPYYYRRELKGWCNKFVYDWWDRESKQWLNSSTPTGDMRSLADIEAIVEKDKKIAELEKENLKALGWIAKAMMQGLNEVDCSDELLKIIAKRDLEQQAKGSDDFYDYLESIENMYIPSDYISDFKKILSEQAKQLEVKNNPAT